MCKDVILSHAMQEFEHRVIQCFGNRVQSHTIARFINDNVFNYYYWTFEVEHMVRVQLEESRSFMMMTHVDMSAIMSNRWDWNTLSLTIPMQTILRYSTLPWDWKCMPYNTSLDISHIFSHLDKPWDWAIVSRRVAVSLSTVIDTVTLWSWDDLSANDCMTIRDVLSCFEMPWNWDRLSSKPHGLCFQDVLSYPDLPWNWHCLSRNPHMVNMTTVLTHPHLPWDWHELSINPSITMRDVETHPDKPWRFGSMMSRQLFKTDLDYHIINVARRWISMQLIHRSWTTSTRCPSFTICSRLCLRRLVI